MLLIQQRLSSSTLIRRSTRTSKARGEEGERRRRRRRRRSKTQGAAYPPALAAIRGGRGSSPAVAEAEAGVARGAPGPESLNTAASARHATKIDTSLLQNNEGSIP
jgi:hypothetical protein